MGHRRLFVWSRINHDPGTSSSTPPPLRRPRRSSCSPLRSPIPPSTSAVAAPIAAIAAADPRRPLCLYWGLPATTHCATHYHRCPSPPFCRPPLLRRSPPNPPPTLLPLPSTARSFCPITLPAAADPPRALTPRCAPILLPCCSAAAAHRAPHRNSSPPRSAPRRHFAPSSRSIALPILPLPPLHSPATAVPSPRCTLAAAHGRDTPSCHRSSPPARAATAPTVFPVGILPLTAI
ncbi:hypothetical protein C8R44DRAFT_891349 [Mycena epipterygia]|nr:hypothetical protein C8R44DRAFT_891349 [Mycena epipterygia]